MSLAPVVTQSLAKLLVRMLVVRRRRGRERGGGRTWIIWINFLLFALRIEFSSTASSETWRQVRRQTWITRASWRRPPEAIWIFEALIWLEVLNLSTQKLLNMRQKNHSLSFIKIGRQPAWITTSPPDVHDEKACLGPLSTRLVVFSRTFAQKQKESWTWLLITWADESPVDIEGLNSQVTSSCVVLFTGMWVFSSFNHFLLLFQQSITRSTEFWLTEELNVISAKSTSWWHHTKPVKLWFGFSLEP